MPKGREYTFRISAYTPDTIPMSRLAEYMTDLATFLGENGSVHFVRLEEGSTKLAYVIEDEAVPKVDERIDRVRTGDGPTDALKAFGAINRRLAEDNGVAEITELGRGAQIIQFPGKAAIEEKGFSHVTQEGSLDGEVIMVGGPKDLVPVHLQAGTNRYNCVASRPTAKALAEYLFTGQVRVFGTGKWIRGETGTWSLDRFQIRRFEPLDDRPLSQVLEELRAMPDTEWHTSDDIWAELDLLRNGPSELH